MLLFKLGRKVSETGGTGTADHRRVLIAKFDELFAEALFLLTSPVVAWREKAATADAAGEPLALRELDHDGAEDIHHFSVTKVLRNLGQGLGGTFADDGLILARKVFEQRQEKSLVSGQVEHVAKLLGDGVKDFVILLFDQLFQVRDEQLRDVIMVDGHDDRLQPVDRVHLDVDLLTLHLLL